MPAGRPAGVHQPARKTAPSRPHRCGPSSIALDADLVAVGQQHGAMDRVLQLAHVAAPAVAGQAQQARRATVGRYGRPFTSAYLRAKCSASAAMSPGRSRSGGTRSDTTFRRKYRSSRKVPRRTSAEQVAVGGGQDAHVHLDRRCAAQPVDLALLQRAQQLGLQAHVHLADLVQQQGAAAGGLEFADAARQGAGEGALLVAEQFRLQQVFGDGGAVQRDERAGGAARAAVQMARQDLLAGAGFAADQHRRFGLRHLLGAPDGGGHSRIAHDQRVGFAGGGLQDGRDQVGVGRQRQEFARAGADRAQRGFGVALVPQATTGTAMRSAASARTTAPTSWRQIAQHEIHARIGAQVGQRGLGVVRLVELRAAGDGEASGLAELAGQRADDQDAHGQFLT